MTSREHEKAMHSAIESQDWDKVLDHASRLPKGWNAYEQLPSAAPHMPESHINQILDKLQNDKSQKTQYLFELSHNLQPDHSPELLNRLAEDSKEDSSVLKNILEHPNYQETEDTKNKKIGTNFWSNYEKEVTPLHFATIKSMHTNQPEKIIDHRGKEATSEHAMEWIPHLRNHAKASQDEVLKDETIRKRMINGKPHIKVYRGVGGNYGAAIHKAANINHNDKTVHHKTLEIPTAHMASWTLNPDMADRFAWGRGGIEGQEKDKGVVMSKWMPVDNILHTGIHTIVPGAYTHHNEAEIVFAHPKENIKVHTKDLKFQESNSHTNPNVSYGDTHKFKTIKPEKIKKSEVLILQEDIVISEELNKTFKQKIVNVAAAMALLGAPANIHYTTKDPSFQGLPSESTPHPDLHAVARIESAGGKNTRHPMQRTGIHKGTSAIGAYGLMPLTVTETIEKNPALLEKYPELHGLHYQKDFPTIQKFLEDNPKAQTDIANAHWNRIQKIFHNDKNKMAYAWNKGIAGAQNTDDESIKADDYVRKYNKYSKMQSLETNPTVIKKSEFSKVADKLSEEGKHKFDGLVGFKPIEHTPLDQKAAAKITNFIQNKHFHDLSNKGHFTSSAFIAGRFQDEAWLVKPEPTNRPAIKAAKHGMQVFKETAFYHLLKDVFGLGQFNPETVLGFVQYKNEKTPAAAIKMLPESFKQASDFEDDKKGALPGILEKYRIDGTVHKLAIVDMILGNQDSHGGNLMTDGTNIKVIDHGSAFSDSEFGKIAEKHGFIPYVLRAGKVKSKASPEEKLSKMTNLNDQPSTRIALAHWLFNIDDAKLIEIMRHYDLDPNAALERLNWLRNRVKSGEPIDHAVNEFWVYGFKPEKKHSKI